MRKILSSCLMVLFIAACQPVPVTVQPELSFTHYQPIFLKVSKIDVVQAYQSPLQLPNVEQLMPYSPSDAMRIWVHDRLHASGGDRTLQVIIKDASVIQTQLPKPSGMEGFFTKSQDKRYDARLEVEMRVYGADPMSEANISVLSTRSVTVPIDASVAQRESVFRRMIFELMENANAELEKNIYQYFTPYINYTHTPG